MLVQISFATLGKLNSSENAMLCFLSRGKRRESRAMSCAIKEEKRY